MEWWSSGVLVLVGHHSMTQTPQVFPVRQCGMVNIHKPLQSSVRRFRTDLMYHFTFLKQLNVDDASIGSKKLHGYDYSQILTTASRMRIASLEP
jgi:hypothetical protein